MSDQFFRPVVSQRLPSGTFFAELHLAAGPVSIGSVGQNRPQDILGRPWALVVDRTAREVQLWQFMAGEWQRVPRPGHPIIDHAAGEGARRFTLTFDQSARSIVAYEDGGIIKLTRWDPVLQGYVQNVSFPGADPQVVLDATWTAAIPTSDVLLFYLSPDRERVYARVQRDVYAVPVLLHDFGVPVILDRVTALPLRYQLLVSDAQGRPLPEVLLSDLYPYQAVDGVQVAGELTGVGAYRPEVVSYAAAPEAVSVSGEQVGAVGAYRPAVIEYAGPAPGQVAVVGVLGDDVAGVYSDAVLRYEAEREVVVVAGSMVGATGEHKRVIINMPAPAPERAVVAGAMTGIGEYRNA